MLKLFFIKAGDEINNADFFVWAHDAELAKILWKGEGHGDESDIDRIWELPAKPPATAGIVDWDGLTVTR